MDSCRFYIYRTYHLQIQTVLVLLSDIEDFNFFFLTELLRNSLVAQLVKNPPAMQETLVGFRVRKIHWRRDRLSTLIFLGFPCDSDSKESTCNVEDLGSIPGLGRSPGEGNGYRSSILAWRIPWTEEPRGLQSMGSQRAGQDWAHTHFTSVLCFKWNCLLHWAHNTWVLTIPAFQCPTSEVCRKALLLLRVCAHACVCVRLYPVVFCVFVCLWVTHWANPEVGFVDVQCGEYCIFFSRDLPAPWTWDRV